MRYILALAVNLLVFLTSAQDAYERCTFRDKDSLSECQEAFRRNAELACEGNLPVDKPPAYGAAWGALRSVGSLNGPSFVTEVLDDDLDNWSGGKIANEVLKLTWWGTMWGVAGIVLVILTLTTISTYLFCCCCRKKSKPKPMMKILGIVIVAVFGTIAVGCLIGAQVGGFLFEKVVTNEAECRVMSEPYSLLYESRTVGVNTFDGVLEFLNFGEDASARLYFYSSFIGQTQGRVGRLAMPLIHGIFAPLLWTHSVLSSTSHTGWRAADSTYPAFSTNLYMQHNEEFSEALKAPATGVFMTYGQINDQLWNDQSIDFDFQSVVNGLNEVESGLEDAVDEIENVLDDVSEGLDVFRDVSNFFERLSSGWWWFYHIIPILGYVFLIIGGYFFYKFLQRKSPSQRSAHGLRAYVYIGFWGTSIWFLMAGALFCVSHFAADGCNLARRDLLQNGEYDRIFEIDDQRARDLLRECATENGNGKLLEALDLDDVDYDFFHEDIFENLENIFPPGDYLYTSAISNVLEAHETNEDLLRIRSSVFTHSAGVDALSEQGMRELTEAVNDIFGINAPNVRICFRPDAIICGAEDGTTVYQVNMNTIWGGNTIDPLFRESPPDSISDLYYDMTANQQTIWAGYVRHLVVTGMLYYGEGIARTDTSIPQSQSDWENYAYNICPIGAKCAPFHMTSIETEDGTTELKSISLASLNEWRTAAGNAIREATQITSVKEISGSFFNGFSNSGPVAIVDQATEDIESRWTCNQAYETMDSLARVVCAGGMGHVAVVAWCALSVAIAHLFLFSFALAHWARRCRVKEDKPKDGTDDVEKQDSASPNQDPPPQEGPSPALEERDNTDLFNQDGPDTPAPPPQQTPPPEEKPSISPLQLPPTPPNTEDEQNLLAAAHLGRTSEISSTELLPNTVIDNIGGNTPLHLSANGGYRDCVQVLCEQGWDPNARNKLGLTPAEVVMSNNDLSPEAQNRILTVLSEYGAETQDISPKKGLSSPIGNVSYRFSPTSG